MTKAISARREISTSAPAITEKFAPNSLVVAQSLSNLGGVALAQNDLAAARDNYQMALAIREQQAPNSLEIAQSLSDWQSRSTRRRFRRHPQLPSPGSGDPPESRAELVRRSGEPERSRRGCLARSQSERSRRLSSPSAGDPREDSANFAHAGGEPVRTWARSQKNGGMVPPRLPPPPPPPPPCARVGNRKSSGGGRRRGRGAAGVPVAICIDSAITWSGSTRSGRD